MIFKHKLIQKLILSLTIFTIVCGFVLPGQTLAQSDTGYPKIANYYIAWDVSDEQAKELAKWDVVILAPQAAERNPDLIDIIRKNNPQIKILVYSIAVDINYTVITESPLYQRVYPKIQENDWWLYDMNGQHLSNWPNCWVINPARNAPRINGQNWSDYLPQHVYNEFFKDNKYDGVFFDNVWPSVSWISQNVDLDRNGQADSASERDASWMEGLNYILTETRRLAPNKIIMVNNTGNYYNSKLNGRMQEMFPNNNEGGWTGSMKNYLNDGLGYQPEYFVINGGTKNTGNKFNLTNFRLSLTSTLLGDGFYSFDYGDQDHGSIWWYDEYDVNLGNPISSPKNVLEQSTEIKPSVWQRDFQNGIVLVNSTDNEQKVTLPTEYEKIKGTQDKTVNNGAIVKNVKLNPDDGLILLRRIQDIKNAPYYNGSFVRVFNKRGETERNGFFLYDKQYKGNYMIAKKDINKDGKFETIVANGGKITIYNEDNTSLTAFYPYGDKYNKGLNFSLSDFENDGYVEIITGTGKGYAPLVKVFNSNGEEQGTGFYAYAKSYLGGVNVAVCSTQGNGNKEIVTGTGFMGGSQVRIFDKNGKVLSGGFFAYGKTFRGGVNVACGDIDGNGKDEIVTGAGYGGSSHVRIFNSKFEALSPGFFAFGKDSKTGVRVFLSDIDNNGIQEILTATPDVFMSAFANN
ncbi:MAG: putative glycoside hydrolase [Candidatus Parcubacteria bacterium]|nr:putative glycoside hydrolase [Candidatus Parcubacteria bacterium]